MSANLLRNTLLIDSPVGYWPCDEKTGTTMYDRSGNARNGTIDATTELNARCAVNRNRKGCYRQTTTGTPMATIAGAAFLNVQKVFTVEAWVRFSSEANSDAQIFNREASNNWTLTASGNNTSFKIRLYTYGGTVIADTAYIITDAYRWHHVAVSSNGTFNSTNLKIYVDGVDVTPGTITDRTVSSDTTTAGRIGLHYLASFHIAHVALFATALTSTRIVAHYNAGRVTPDRGGPTKYGLHQDLHYLGTNAERTSQIALATSASAKISRSLLRWRTVETSQGTYDWTAVDDMVNQLTTAGIEPLLFIAGSPNWANGGSTEWTVPTTATPFNNFVTYYASFAAACVARYGSAGTNKVKKWEIWNEPNLAGFWNPTPNATNYAALANAARTSMLAQDATAQLSCCILGSVGAAGAPDITGLTFLQSAITAGLSASFDIYSLHPYHKSSGDPRQIVSFDVNFYDVERVLDILWKNGRLKPSTKVWLTEFGWDTGAVTQAVQSANMLLGLQMIRDYWSRYVSVAILFADSDGGGKALSGIFGASPTFTAKTAKATFTTYMAYSQG